MRLLATLAFVSFICLAIPAGVRQNANLTEDSLGLAAQGEAYNYLFPLLGKEMLVRGIDIPFPVVQFGNNSSTTISTNALLNVVWRFRI